MALLLVSSAKGEAPPDSNDLPSFRRVLLPTDRLPRELERVRQGVLVQMPLAEFEERVRKAARAAAAQKNPPRLLETHYRAILKDTALYGTGQWKVQNPETAPAVLRLQPLNLALRQLRFENRDALLADFDGKSPGLLLDEAGLRSVSIEWTARGEPSPEGLLFDLRVPACAISTLELDLPAGHAVSVSPEGCLVSGPHPADEPGKCRWKVGFGGRSQLFLTIKPLQGTGQPPPLVLAQMQTTQKLNPDALEAEFVFDLKVLHQGVQELRLECDPSLRPHDVSVPRLDSWELIRPEVPSGSPPAPLILVVRLREPLQAGLLRIACLAPLETPGGQTAPTKPPVRRPRTVAWESPGIRLNGSVLRGETLELHFHPDIRLESWQPGLFRLTRARTETDGTQVWTLTGGSLEVDKPPQGNIARRPSARVQTLGVEYLARQQTWWQVGPERSSLEAWITYEVTHGRLFELPVSLPPNWEVDRVTATVDRSPVPEDLVRAWDVRQAGNRATLIVELKRPLGPGVLTGEPAEPKPTTQRLTVRLRPTREGGGTQDGTDVVFPFPDIVPLGPRLHEGGLAVDFDQQLYEATASTTAPLAPTDEEGPWRRQTPDHYYLYRGGGVRGTLRLQQRAPRVRTRCTSEVVLSSGRARVAAHLSLHPEQGAADFLDVSFSAPLTGKWTWQTGRGNNEVRSFEWQPAIEALPRLSALGLAHPLSVAGFLAAPLPAGERWRLTFSRPLREPLVLHGSGELSRAAGSDLWDVPLLTVPGANRMEGEVKLFLSGADVVQIDPEGLREAQPPEGVRARPRAPSPWRTFTYGQPSVGLVLRGQTLPADRAGEAVADHAVLTTYVEPGGRLLHHYRFQLWGWRESSVPVRLPAGARLLAARVQGHWVTQLPPAREGRDSSMIELPAPIADQGAPAAERSSRWYELLYAVDCPRWLLWARLEAEPPTLPVQTLARRQTWCLPPGLAPLLDGRLQELPGPATGQAWERGGLGAWERLPRANVLELWRTHAFTAPGDDRELQQRQLLDAAAAALARVPVSTLGELIDRLVFEQLRDQDTLVLDVGAMQEMGLNPATPLPALAATPGARPAPPWEAVGLVHVPCQAAPLLTTRRQFESWQTAGRPGHVSESIEEAVAAAAALGHDDSGGFRSAADWLRQGQDNGQSSLVRPAFALLQAEFPWTEWEPIAGTRTPSVFLVVRHEVMPGLGLALAAILSLVFWRSGARRLVFLLVWLGAFGLAILWLPAALQSLAWWPLVAGSVIAFVWYLWSSSVTITAIDSLPTPPVERGGAAAAVLTLVCAAGLASQAAAPQPSAVPTVFLVPGPADVPEKQTVLVPPELLEQLETLTRRGGAGTRNAVILSAAYQGEVLGGAAEFRAVFQVHCFTDEVASLSLPLDGAQLQEDVLLDGARAYPTALRPPQIGYVLQVKGRGVHTVRMRFRVPVQAVGEDRSLRFTAPGLLQNRLTLDAPPGAVYLQAFLGTSPARGAQNVSTDGKGGARLESDLGRPSPPAHTTSPLLVRWRQETLPPRKSSVQVKEAYLWNLRTDASSLTAVVRFTVSQAPAATLVVGLPDGLEVQGVEAAPPRLKDWRVVAEKGRRRLLLEFGDPVLGEVQTTLQLVPARPFGVAADLLLPVPQANQSTERLLAYRLEGLEARVTDHKFFTGIDPDRFVEAWKKAGRTPPPSLVQAFTFERRSGDAPLLRLQLAIPPPLVSATTDVHWRVSQQQAEFRATAQLTAPDGNLALVEWEGPAVEMLTSVSGPDIRHWTRAGNRVQVWLQRSVASTEVQLAGWLPLRAPKDGPVLFQLPPLRLVAVQNQRSLVRVQAGGDAAVVPAELHQLWHFPDTRPSDHELAYVAPQPNYRGTFRVRPLAATADVKVLTFVEVRDRQLVFIAKVDLQVRQGELRRIAVRLRNWLGEAQLDAPEPALGGVVVRGPAEDRTWTVPLAAGVSGRYRLTLTGHLPLEKAAAGAAVPDVSAGRAERFERWLAVGGRDLEVEPSPGLALATDPDRDLQPWPAEAERLRRAGGQVWRVEAGEGAPPRLLPRPRAAQATPVQVFLVEQRAAVVDGRHWAHQATYWLYHEANTDLTVQLPQGARVIGVLIDEAPVTPLQPSPNQLWMPLPAGAGARTVRLRWTYDSEAEGLERPRLERPRLEGAAEGPSVWTVHVPPEYHANLVATPSETSVEAISAAGLSVRRAEALLRLSGVLAEQVRERGSTDRQQLEALQRRFYEDCRFAAQEVAASVAQLRDDGPRRAGLAHRLEELNEANKNLTSQLQDLQKQNRQLAQASNFEDLRARAERQARAGEPFDVPPPVLPGQLPFTVGAEGERVVGLAGGPLPERGEALRWQADPESPSLLVQLTRLQTGETRRTLAASVLLVVLLLVAGVVARFPGAQAWVRAFWPEQMALLGLLGWQMLGLNLVVVFLILLGICARLIALGQSSLLLLRRLRPAPATSGDSRPPPG